MESTTFQEDLLANAILAAGMVFVMLARDLCKRVAHSDCRYTEEGLRFKLPTYHENPCEGEAREI